MMEKTMSINNVVLSGRLGKDAVKGEKFVKFSMAVDKGYVGVYISFCVSCTSNESAGS